ncbi:MAG: hypothetical protein ABI995_04185, partial [Acidobacteriota bacterium]
RLAVDPGAFRVQEYEAPASAVLRATAPPPDLGRPEVHQEDASKQEQASAATQALVDGYRNRAGGRRTAETLPVRVTFPSVGPSAFLVSELTGESKGAVIEFGYQKDKKGGVR